MNKEELKQRLNLERVRPDVYSLEGGLPGETFCLAEENGKWHVYYSERGKKTGLKEFQTENEACEFLYTEIITTKDTRMP